MKSFIAKQSNTTEFITVVVLAFGMPIFSAMLAWHHALRKFTLTDARLWHTVLFEIAIGSLLCLLLRVRGWTWADLELRATWQSTLAAVPVTLGTFLIALVAGLLVIRFVNPHGLHSVRVASRTTLGLGLLASFFNALYEEVFVAAYIIKAAGKYRGVGLAVLASVLIRTSYHVYEGIPILFFVIPLGVFYAWLYLRYRTLWPIVLAHTAYDLAAFSVLQHPAPHHH